MARRLIAATISVFIGLVAVALWNYTTVSRPASQAISVDPRNKGVDIFVHYKWFTDPNILVFDLRSVSGNNSPADVTRTLLQSAEILKNNKINLVILSCKGNPKFMLKGNYFHTLGAEYGIQNPVYTLRTLPENIYDLDGKQVFGAWTGGVLGVIGKQMEDLNELHRRWYLSDLATGN
ncbi:MAG: hypothetical protein PHI97_24455 [Desulfobulbus sp.]|nr:hypothetical protein [Desulfobulbus sp.]